MPVYNEILIILHGPQYHDEGGRLENHMWVIEAISLNGFNRQCLTAVQITVFGSLIIVWDNKSKLHEFIFEATNSLVL